MKHLISKADLARRAGVSRAAISKLFKSGGKLESALVESQVDAGHPLVQEYLAGKEASTVFEPKPKFEHTETQAFPDEGTPQAMVDFQSLTLGELSDRFGGIAELADWLKALKISEEIRGARLKNDEYEGSIISRDLVVTHCFGALDETNRRLLSDGVKTIVRQMYANSKGGIELEKSEREASSMISKILEPARQKIAKALKNGG